MPLTDITVANQIKDSENKNSKMNIESTFADSKNEHCENELDKIDVTNKFTYDRKRKSHPSDLPETRKCEVKSKSSDHTNIELIVDSCNPSNINDISPADNELELSSISHNLNKITFARDIKDITPAQITSQKLVARKTNLLLTSLFFGRYYLF